MSAVDTAPHADLGDLPAAGSSRPPKRVPAAVWWITGLHVTLLFAYSILLPTYRAPDEQLHVDLARVVSEEGRYPAWDERDTGRGIQRSLAYVHYDTQARNLRAADALPRDTRPSFDDLDAATEPPAPPGINQVAQHPPLYYLVAGGTERAVEVVTGEPDFQLETWFYRVVSVALVGPLPLVVWRVARLLGLPGPVCVAATLVPLAVPQYLHIAASVNNDSLQFILFWLLTPVVLRLADGQLAPRTAALAGLLTGAGLLTKGFAVVMGLWVVAGLALALLRLGRAALGSVIRAGLVFSAVSLAAGGWWWVRNLIVYGEVMPSRYDEIVVPVADDARDLGLFVRTWATATNRRFWGDFGWFDVHLSGVVTTLATAVCLVALVSACRRHDRVSGSPVGSRLLLAAPFVLLVAIQFAVALDGYLQRGRMAGLQGRYWFGALAALAVLVALGFASLAPRQVHRLPLAVFAGAAVMQCHAFAAIIGHYWGAPGAGLADRVRAVVAWAPIEGEVIALVAVVGAAILASTLVQVVSMARHTGQAH